MLVDNLIMLKTIKVWYFYQNEGILLDYWRYIIISLFTLRIYAVPLHSMT